MIPSLPTDNLYKFIAISGLIMTLVAIIYPMTILDSAYLKIADLKSRRTNIEYELDKLHAKDTLINMKLNELRGNIINDSIMEKEYKNLYSVEYNNSIRTLCRSKEFREYYAFVEKYENSLFPFKAKMNEIEDLRKEREDLRIKIINLLKQSNIISGKIDSEIKIYESKREIIFILLFMGMVLTFSGFFLWYIKVQHLLDIKLKQETYRLLLNNGKLTNDLDEKKEKK